MLTLIACYMLVLLDPLGVEIHITFLVIWIACTIYCIICRFSTHGSFSLYCKRVERREEGTRGRRRENKLIDLLLF